MIGEQMRSSGFRFCILVCDIGSTQIGGREPFSPKMDAPLADPWAAPLSVTSLLSVLMLVTSAGTSEPWGSAPQGTKV